MPQRDSRVFELLGHVSSGERWLLLALKFIPAISAQSEKDELWIRTAHPYGKKNFLKAERKGLLQDIFADQPSNTSVHTDAFARARDLDR